MEGIPQPGAMNTSRYDHIELTDAEKEEALFVARRAKDKLNNQQEYWDKVRKPVEYPKLTMLQLREKVVSENPKFILDGYNSEIFDMLCSYFSGDESYEGIFGGSLDKGIMLFGPVGCGKTSLMRMFSNNSFRPFVVNPVRKISDEYASNGNPALYKFSSQCEVYAHENFGHALVGRCFDDVGTEEIKKNFGNEVNVMQDVLYKIYDNRGIGDFHVTTNLDGEGIKNAYGDRIRSRMREMFNVIRFNSKAPDRRG